MRRQKNYINYSFNKDCSFQILVINLADPVNILIVEFLLQHIKALAFVELASCTVVSCQWVINTFKPGQILSLINQSPLWVINIGIVWPFERAVEPKRNVIDCIELGWIFVVQNSENVN